MKKLLIKIILTCITLLQGLILFYSGFILLYEFDKLGDGSIAKLWCLISILAFWIVFKRSSRYILLRLVIIFDKLFSSTNLKTIFESYLSEERKTTNLDKVRKLRKMIKTKLQARIIAVVIFFVLLLIYLLITAGEGADEDNKNFGYIALFVTFLIYRIFLKPKQED